MDIRNIDNSRSKLYIYLAMFLTSLSLFIYETLLTRLFSAILNVTMVFLVISFAILGSGLGGIIAHNILKKKKLSGRDILLKFSVLLPTIIGLSVGTIYFLPYIPIYIIYAIMGAVPFVIGGVAISVMFMNNAESSKLYFMDLIGSALGSLAVIQLMNKFGFMTSVAAICTLTLIAAIFINLHYRENKRAVALGLFLILLFGLLIQGSLIRQIEENFNAFYTNPDKIITYLNDTDSKPEGISYTKWDAISRTDVIDIVGGEEKIIATDGGGAAPMVKFDGDLKKVEYLKQEVNYISFSFGSNNSALVIGSGGGKDVLFALLGGTKKVDAVEINPSTIEAVEKFKDFNGDIYNRPGVKVYNQDGRNFVENSKEKYDNIYLSMVMTNAIENNMYSLSENYIYTYEAFEQYFNHLTEEGKLSFMTHSSFDLVKIANTGIKVLLDKGVKQEEVTDYFVVVNGMEKGDENNHGAEISMPLIMFKNKPFTKDEINTIRLKSMSQNRDVVHYPGNEIDIYRPLKDKTMSYDELIDKIQVNIKPTRDNSPFFYNNSKFVPVEMFYVLLAIVPIWTIIRKRLEKQKYKKASLYFGGLGIAFMLVEIPVIQKMVLYFGNPSLAFSAVLFSILVSSGVGSVLSGLKPIRKLVSSSPIYLLTAAVSIVAVQLTMGKIMRITNDFSIYQKFITSFLLLLPMGLLMGIPFPTGISKLRELSEELEIIPLIWGVNGVFSIVGSLLAVVISMMSGFNTALYIGAAVYMMLYVLNPLKLISTVED